MAIDPTTLRDGSPAVTPARRASPEAIGTGHALKVRASDNCLWILGAS